MAQLFSNYYEKRYKISVCSSIALIWLIFFVLAIIGPYLLAWYAGGLWTKQRRYYEHPDTKFTGYLVITALDDEGQTTIFSTVKEINDMQANSGGVPTITIKQESDPKSGKLDRLQLNFVMQGTKAKKIRNLQVIGSFNYNLRQLLKIEMTSLLHVEIDTPNGVSKAIVDGYLRFEQDEPILIETRKRSKYYPDLLAPKSYKKFSFPELFQKNMIRTERTKYDYTYLVQPVGTPYKTQVSINVKIPVQQRVEYIPGTIETIKFGLTQYVALLIPTLWICNRIAGFLFARQIIETSIAGDLVPRKKTLTGK